MRPLEKRLKARYEQILLDTKVAAVRRAPTACTSPSKTPRASRRPESYDRVLVAVGRVPNGRLLGAEAAGVTVNERGFIPVDSQMRTNVPHIFAIGDVVGQPMLAHKATHEGKVAAEVAAGHKRHFDARVDSLGGLHRSGSGLGGAHRDGRRRRRASRSRRGPSPGPPAAARCRWGATKASPS